MRFAELMARSSFSFLSAASHPEELVIRSKQLGLEAIALCDRDGLYGSPRMHLAGQNHEQRVLVGAELTLQRPEPLPYNRFPYPSVALLAQDHDGYRSLCRLITRAHAHHEKGQAGIDMTDIAAQRSGLLALLPVDPQAPLNDQEMSMLTEAFGNDAAVVVWRHLDATDSPRMAHAQAVSLQYELPIVASARPRYHDKSRHALCDVMQCIRDGTTLHAAGLKLHPNAEARLRSGKDMNARFPHHPEWLTHSLTLAERCSFSMGMLQYRFPTDTDQDCPNDALACAVKQGAEQRYPQGVPQAVQRTIERELALIAQLDVAPYFLSVKTIVDMARERQILCQGRGSAANSAVCYALGITAVDPARSSLLFERFMSPERKEPPDIDVDFEHERREEVIQAIYERYGRERAAMVSEVICFRGKSALRETAKVFELAPEQQTRLSSLAMALHEQAPHKRQEALRSRGLDADDEGLTRVIDLAHQLEGMPRHLSVHVGGFVLSASPLDEVAPIEPARMPGRTVIPWDKDDLDTLGLFKVDVLGLGMLTAIRKALASIHEGPAKDFDPIGALARIPAEDPRVYDAICEADTMGVFQIESRAQMAMLPLLRPRCFYDLVIEVGIVRPGPIQGKMVHPYLKRRTGQEPIDYPHPSLEPILCRTLGVPLFQEQVMQIAIVAAGYTPGEADQLRRDMAAWSKHGRLEAHRERLYEGFRRTGIDDAFCERLFRQIKGFGEYGFPESHAASFALLVYASAWLKVHHAAAFACALLNSQPMGFYPVGSIVSDARKHGVEVLPVCVLSSDEPCTLHPGKTPKRPALRLGLRHVRGLSHTSIIRMVQARLERPFTEFEDFVRRSGLKRNELEALAQLGALRGLCRNRREALWRLRAPREEGLLQGKNIEPPEPVGLRAMSGVEQLCFDYAGQGFSIDDHPMRYLRKTLTRRRVKLAREQSSWRRHQRVTVAGVVLCRQRPYTAKGIVFITLEDETGVINLVVYPSIYERYLLAAKHAGMMLARGRVDRRGSVVHLRAHYLERLDGPTGPEGQLSLRSRDFH